MSINGTPSVRYSSSIASELLALETLILTLSNVVRQAYPSITINAGGSHIANMNVLPSINAPLYVRLLWKKQHPDVKYMATLDQCYQLEDNYLSFGIFNWRTLDPLLAQQFLQNGV